MAPRHLTRVGGTIAMWVAVALGAAALAPIAAHPATRSITVPSQANVFAAGHASAPAPGGGGAGMLPPVVPLPAGDSRIVRFPSLSGSAFAACSGGRANGPNGSCNARGTDIQSVGGIAGLIASSNMMLVGVFLGPGEPADPAPPRLDFGPAALGESFADLKPAARQVFFVGDGRTAGGAVQRFHVPRGATRLFLGIADAPDFHGLVCCYADNTGAFAATVEIAAAAIPAPVLGRRVNVSPIRGSVFVSVPGATAGSRRVPGLRGRRFAPLRRAAQIPVGSVLDTRKGAVRLRSALDDSGATQSGAFSGGVFQVRQSARRRARGLTELRLRGGSFAGCPSARGKGALAARARGRTVRRMRANVRGRARFRGTARFVSGTVRGTAWITIDRCDTSIAKVRRGVVAVRDFRRRATVEVRGGQDYVGCAPGFRLPASQARTARDVRLSARRRLRTDAMGRFRTCGRYSAATVRGG